MGSLFQFTSAALPFLMLLNNSAENTTLPVHNDSFTNATADATPLKIPTDFSSLFTFIYSFSALRDYLKLIVLGGAFETLRRLYSASYRNLMDRFFITATFESEDSSYEWMMFWLSSRPQFRQFRDFSVSTSGLSDDSALEIDDNMDEELRRRTRPVRYLPSYSSNCWLWYKGRYITISRTKEENRWYSDKSTLEITILSRDRSILDSLILEARQNWLSSRSDKIDVYASEGFNNDWNHVASRSKRPLDSIILDDGIRDFLLEDARDFIKSRQWYADRGIPFRRGYLLYGAPGSGKTSIIHSLAGELGLDIYIISLSKTGLDDNNLNSLISSLPEHCIAIMEDIDAAFTHGLTRDKTGTQLEDPRNRDLQQHGRHSSEDDFDDYRQQGRGRNQSQTKDTRVTLSGLLNALDGVSAQEGRLLFATTNRYHSLDPALIRPGRMDIHIEFRLASHYQARELYKRFYFPDAPDEVTMNDEASSDSGYVTPTTDASDPIGPDEPPKYNGTTHSARAPKLSKKKIEQLAEQFAARIPERELSMASLQGYLMSYKTRPFQAVDDVERWVEDTREGQDRRTAADKA
ncbi:P-loop containing nucleoside triphosphate hydrolase protein [Russula ochroleuca]|uniref:P-loop containing nucleoside triphosphate hydrolase protein n=1 Tax=Russula ochroleuca TaxID=152965 RepID=A0A9P5JSV8_9AGAM|nr:P-loop containing nucleoside triphosphate hydrolase protein [Russula ochroleuca]